uniref:Protein with signal anchor n=1 Tax=Anopheles epiroticus TaxID=199890 RepID=A0A182PG89_9DIPT
MEVLREKLAKMAGGIRQAVGWFKAGGIVSSMVLIYVLHMLWPDFRPFSILFVIAIGFLWDRPPVERPSPSLRTSPLGELCSKVWALRATRPIAMVVGSAVGILTYGYLVCYVLPLWLSLALAGLVVFWDRCLFSISYTFSTVSSERGTMTEQEIDEFVPELTEVSRVLLQEVGEQGADTSGPLLDGCAVGTTPGARNSAEEDEEQYLRTLIPEASGNDFEAAELSGSSSDELFCPDEGPLVRMATGGSRTYAKPAERPIEFKSSHFNANSSSDSDDNMSRGLNFNDDIYDGVSRRSGSRQPQQQPQPQQQSAEAMLMMSATSLASNVLVDTVYKRLLDAGTMQSALGSTLQALRGQTVQEEDDDASTDADEDSEFEMLNSEELNNL